MNQEQEIIEGLGSAIIDYTDGNIFVVGFYSMDRLLDWEKGIDCWQSKSIFKETGIVFDYSKIRDNALFIVKKEGIETERYLYEPFFKGTVRFSNIEKKGDTNNNGKTASRIITIRRCLYNKQYSIVYHEKIEKQFVKNYLVCFSIEDVFLKLDNLFPSSKLYDTNNKLIKDGFDHIKQMEIVKNAKDQEIQLKLF